MPLNNDSEPQGPSVGLTAIIVGTALGTGLAILLNSKPGQQMRESAAIWLNDQKTQLASAITEGRERVINDVEKNKI